MPRGTVEEFLRVASQSKRVQFFNILSHHKYEPGDGGSLNKTGRVSLTPEGKRLPCPFKHVLHVLQRNALLGVNYEDMVNRRRVKEADEKLAELVKELPAHVKVSAEVDEFIAEKLWFGKGERDEEFPKLAARHKEKGTRYLVFWPATDANGKLLSNVSEYFDETGRKLDFEKELKEFWQLPSKSKVQGLDKEVHWQTVKFSNIVRISSDKLVWDFDPVDD